MTVVVVQSPTGQRKRACLATSKIMEVAFFSVFLFLPTSTICIILDPTPNLLYPPVLIRTAFPSLTARRLSRFHLLSSTEARLDEPRSFLMLSLIQLVCKYGVVPEPHLSKDARSLTQYILIQKQDPFGDIYPMYCPRIKWS